MYKIDLHTHSTASPDGGISAAQYKRILDTGALHCVAITDHNRIDFAVSLQQDLGEKVIVGEEIMSSEGEIVGLYLTERIEPGLSAGDTVAAIRAQSGIVYIPHPFETVRKGLHPALMEELLEGIDLVEVCNGRAFAGNRSEQAVVWAKLNHVPGAASSDAHGLRGLGQTYTLTPNMPLQQTLINEIKNGTLIAQRPNLRALLYPKYHRLRKKLKRGTA